MVGGKLRCVLAIDERDGDRIELADRVFGDLVPVNDCAVGQAEVALFKHAERDVLELLVFRGRQADGIEPGACRLADRDQTFRAQAIRQTLDALVIGGKPGRAVNRERHYTPAVASRKP